MSLTSEHYAKDDVCYPKQGEGAIVLHCFETEAPP